MLPNRSPVQTPNCMTSISSSGVPFRGTTNSFLRKYMDRCGRTEDLVVFSPEGPHRFNFMEYERRRMTRGGGKGCCVYIIQTVSNYHHTLGPGGH